jgi:hypothetical protein
MFKTFAACIKSCKERLSPKCRAERTGLSIVLCLFSLGDSQQGSLACAGDGCSSDCKVELGWFCDFGKNGAGDICVGEVTTKFDLALCKACGEHQMCIFFRGRQACTCKPHFLGYNGTETAGTLSTTIHVIDPLICIDVNECTLTPVAHQCADQDYCHNTPGSYECRLKIFFVCTCAHSNYTHGCCQQYRMYESHFHRLMIKTQKQNSGFCCTLYAQFIKLCMHYLFSQPKIDRLRAWNAKLCALVITTHLSPRMCRCFPGFTGPALSTAPSPCYDVDECITPMPGSFTGKIHQ